MRIDDDVLAVLSRSTVVGSSLVIPDQLDRKLYVKTNKVLEAAGGKWNRKARAHIFDCDAEARVDQMILSGEIEIPKDEFNYFPSPPAVVETLIRLADIKHGMLVLEPSAGRGAIAFACADRGAIVECYELMEANFQILAAGNRIREVIRADFLQVHPDPDYDAVVMNPPFAGQADIKHVMHAMKFLKPGGILVSVMSAGVMFRENRLTREFREFVIERGGTIAKLPDGAFKESGTMVRTVVVTIPEALR